jgi:LAO/AO transport system kinase
MSFISLFMRCGVKGFSLGVFYKASKNTKNIPSASLFSGLCFFYNSLLTLLHQCLRMPSKKTNNQSALRVQEGIAQPPQLNEELLKVPVKKKPLQEAGYYISGILDGNRTILSQAITLVESALPAHQVVAQKIIEGCMTHSGNSVRVGITGVPGVGKSTFIEAFGMHVIDRGHKVAVLAIDPSSQRSKGSILGDKTRMEELSVKNEAYIRPSPSAGSLGGVARKTRETIVLCEAAGFGVIIIETVGVGQSETAVHSMTDFFLLLMLAGAGDELQGIKRGIMEMADALIINKADGDNITKAQQASVQYQNALHLFPPPPSGWAPRTGTCSALSGIGIAEVWDLVLEYLELTRSNGYFRQNRNSQAISLMMESLNEQLFSSFFSNPDVEKEYQKIRESVGTNSYSPYSGALHLMQVYLKSVRQGD